MTHPALHPVPREIVRYHDLGFHQLFWIRTSDPSDTGKGPRIAGWQHQPPARLEDWRVGMQNGTITGVEIAPGRFLADVDLDWTDPIAVWTKPFLPDTSFGVGRSSKPVSHAFYTTPTPLTSRKFSDVKIGENEPITFVEIRGANLQTMMPPSMHFDSGERLELRDGTIAHVPSEDLVNGVTAYACGCLLGRHWPKNGPLTNQHDVAGYAAATLCKLGVDPKLVPIIIDMAACLGGDDLVRDRVRYAQDTAKKFRAGTLRLAAEKKLAKELGEAVVDQLRDWLLKEPSEDAIRMEGGKLSAIVDRAEEALLVGGVRIYRRGGVLVRPIAIDKVSDDDLIRRAVGSMILSEVREPWLLEQMGQVVEWWKGSARRGWEKADPKSLYSRTLLERGEWRFPALRGVITAPTLGRNGRIIEVPGFDADSGLLLDFTSGSFPPIHPHPTEADAKAALEDLAQPLRGFPFSDDAAKSVALAAMLTALVRSSIRTAPLHAFDAPTAGTGKSMLSEGVGLLATGYRPPAISQGKSAEEDEKRLSTILFAGDPVIHIDNCERPIHGDFLCSMLTQVIVQARILGYSERRVLPSTALVLASGNNLTLAGDVTRRVVMCRIDAGVERPDTRIFNFDLHAEILHNRPSLVVAGLTVLRAYHDAGRPTKLIPMGSFEDYDWIRGALVWLGQADPADTREAILAVDPRRDELVEIMHLWQKAIGTASIEVGVIEQQATGELAAGPKPYSALRDKLIEVACKGRWNAKSVGWWLRRNKDRVVGGRCFRCSADRHMVWSLEQKEPQTRVPGEDDVPDEDEVPF